MSISSADMQAAREFCIKSGHPSGPDFKLVAEAVDAERERCAKIAEQKAEHLADTYANVCADIALTIRLGKE